MTTIRELLEHGRQRLGPVVGDAHLESQVLLAHALGQNRSWLFARPELEPPAAGANTYEQLIRQRAAGHPVAYLVGEREFWSIRLEVTSDTLIPRPETEQLVEAVLELDLAPDACVLELGTGSGAIATALAVERPGWRITATELSAAALAVAMRNARRRELRIRFLAGDWFRALPPGGERFDIIVSNPPYVASGDPHLRQGDLRFEPTQALVAADRGLADLNRIIDGAGVHLRPGGWLWVEHGAEQADAVAAGLRRAGFEGLVTRNDLAGHARHAGGCWPGAREAIESP